MVRRKTRQATKDKYVSVVASVGLASRDDQLHSLEAVLKTAADGLSALSYRITRSVSRI